MSTLKDIARTAGVSLATASRVLNGGKGISQKTCDHVLQIAKDLNYIPNLSAKILAGKNWWKWQKVLPLFFYRTFILP